MAEDESGPTTLAAAPGRILHSDPHDFAGLYIRHRASLTRHARRHLNDVRDADEVVQEAFLRLFLALPELDTELQALAYCRRTITNLCIDRYRADARRPNLVDLESVPQERFADDDRGDPVVRAEDAALVRDALSMLPELHRSALVKREIEEKSLPVIADELAIPEDNVKHLLFRARRTLRKLLAGTSLAPGVDVERGRALPGAARARSGGLAALLVLLLLGLGSGPDLEAVPVVGVDLPDVIGVTRLTDAVAEVVSDVVDRVSPGEGTEAAAGERRDATYAPEENTSTTTSAPAGAGAPGDPALSGGARGAGARPGGADAVDAPAGGAPTEPAGGTVNAPVVPAGQAPGAGPGTPELGSPGRAVEGEAGGADLAAGVAAPAAAQGHVEVPGREPGVSKSETPQQVPQRRTEVKGAGQPRAAGVESAGLARATQAGRPGQSPGRSGAERTRPAAQAEAARAAAAQASAQAQSQAAARAQADAQAAGKAQSQAAARAQADAQAAGKAQSQAAAQARAAAKAQAVARAAAKAQAAADAQAAAAAQAAAQAASKNQAAAQAQAKAKAPAAKAQADLRPGSQTPAKAKSQRTVVPADAAGTVKADAKQARRDARAEEQRPQSPPERESGTSNAPLAVPAPAVP